MNDEQPKVPSDEQQGLVPGESVACCGWPSNGCACQVEYESAPQEPVAYRTRYRSEPGMIGHYPWTYTDRLRGRLDFILEKYEIEPLFAAFVASRAGTEPVAPFGWYGEAKFENGFTTDARVREMWEANGRRVTPLYAIAPAAAAEAQA